ncbi:MAG TPA: ABC transporter ATP-binding protein [Anaerolineales bacterium]|nr:ABC transporter ATP-binding protein [Anaerolineales bacterium]HNC08506.1 ABC transporter ATP-binding protein [Anaerolineales bacterium]
MSAEKFLEVNGLKKYFEAGRPGLFSSAKNLVHAVDGVSFTLHRSEVIALVGESGCGKSTLALLLMGLEEPTDGRVIFENQDITHLNDTQRKSLRNKIQMVFQDPYESLNPTQTIREIVTEPLFVHGMHVSQERDEKVKKAMEDAGLKPAEVYMDRYPHELSGGQRQRVVIAAALVLEPEIIIADEPVSMLDVSIRAEVINLLADLRIKRQIAVIFITHDLGSVGFFADRVAVMYLGRIVEIGTMLEVLEKPQHPYTKALLSVIPVPNPRLRHERTILQGETPNPINIPTGCRFHPRCPVAIESCKLSDPPFTSLSKTHQSACLLLVK